jgi:hypothetical protein
VGQTGIEDLGGMLPPEAFDPHAGTVGSRPASQKVLDNLKRIVILPESAELFDAQHKYACSNSNASMIC